MNVAARLEQATKTFGVPILASEAVRAAAGISGAIWREVSRQPLRGREESMAYYAVENPDRAGPSEADATSEGFTARLSPA